MKRILNRIRFNLFPKKSIEYIGCPALNLGDQALLSVIQSIFPNIILNWPSERFLKMERKKKRLASMLGGGTLIEPGQWGNQFYDKFDRSLESHGRGIVFGTGVANLLFPSYADEYRKDPKRYLKWRSLLNKCNYVGVRGPQSKETLAELGVEAEIIGDPVCSLVQPREFWQPISDHLGINIGHGGGTIWGDRNQLISEVTKFISDATKQGWKIEFFVLTDGDLIMTQKVAAKAGIRNPVIHCECRNAKNYLNQVRRMNVFIGMKLHSVILAMCALVPSIMMEYRPKCLDFMTSMGLESFNIRTSEVNSHKLFVLIESLLSQELIVSKKIEKKMLDFKKLQKNRAIQFLHDSIINK